MEIYYRSTLAEEGAIRNAVVRDCNGVNKAFLCVLNEGFMFCLFYPEKVLTFRETTQFKKYLGDRSTGVKVE